MSLNRTLVGGASAVLSSLGTRQVLLSNLPFECRQAIIAKMADEVIARSCPPGFNDGWLVYIIFVGGALFLVITFWQDIFKFIGEKLGIE